MISHSEVQPNYVASRIATEAGVGGPFIHDVIAPTRTVTDKKFQYAKFDFAGGITEDAETKMPDDGPANEGKSPVLSWTNGICVTHGTKIKVLDSIRRQSTAPEQIERVSSVRLAHKLRLRIEREVKAALDAAANATTLSGTAQWNNASAKIEKSIDDAKEAFLVQYGYEATHLVVPPLCWYYLKRDSTIRDAIRYTNPGILGKRGGIPEDPFGLQLVVPGAIRNTANPGATASVARIWGSAATDDKVYLLYVDPSSSFDNSAPTALSLVQSTQLEDMTFLVKSWRAPEADQEWDWYMVKEAHCLISYAELIHRLDDVLA